LAQKPEVSTILNELLEKYQQEGLPMPYTMQDFLRDVTLEHLDRLSPEERLKGLSTEERLAGLPKEEVEAWLHKCNDTDSKSRSER
jgi:hypothetical protein